MNLRNKTVLLSQYRLVDFTGSEIVTLEMTEYFLSQGAKVLIATNNLDYPIKKYFDKLDNVTIYTDFFDEELDKAVRKNPPALAWIHHQIIIPALFSKQALKKTKYIFNHMSSFYFQEFPIAHNIEQQLADIVLYNSEETKGAFDKDMLLGDVEEKRRLVINNPVPDRFFKEDIRNRDIEKVLVVSNHVPEDLRQAIDLLRKKKILVKIAGAEGGEIYDRITPEILDDTDAVVSIGKTVQYSLVHSTPVYCYDKFGGPGYLDDNNFHKALHYNFSGRGFQKKSSTVIAHEIINGYKKARTDLIVLRESHASLFSLKDTMRAIAEIIDEQRTKTIDDVDRAIYAHHFSLLDKLFKTERQLNNTQKEIEGIKHEQSSLKKTNDFLRSSLDSIENSKGYKLLIKFRKLKGLVWRG